MTMHDLDILAGTPTRRTVPVLGERCPCLFESGKLLRPCYAHYLRMLRVIFRRNDL